eukprot:TRINITY_DN16862_c0_g1_i1.p1 TRINITY_DN16862_c0_g1~~TRINITY_DN16862_c0_g1_i1.p1  ORF type:complete len:157 (+),score=19.72 TRINITY_DN16862_c0_g1_i1:125-595(+)
MMEYFYQTHFIFQNPLIELKAVKRTTWANRSAAVGSLVDEMVVRMTHDREIDWLLPGVKPTGKSLSFPLVVSVDFVRRKPKPGDAYSGWRIKGEHVYWDQATVLRQVGKLVPGEKLETDLPISGNEQAAKVLDYDSVPSNTMLMSSNRYRPPKDQR